MGAACASGPSGGHVRLQRPPFSGDHGSRSLTVLSGFKLPSAHPILEVNSINLHEAAVPSTKFKAGILQQPPAHSVVSDQRGELIGVYLFGFEGKSSWTSAFKPSRRAETFSTISRPAVLSPRFFRDTGSRCSARAWAGLAGLWPSTGQLLSAWKALRLLASKSADYREAQPKGWLI